MESLRRNWLPSRVQEVTALFLARLIGSLAVGLVLWLLTWLILGQDYGLVYGLVLGFVLTWHRHQEALAERVEWRWQRLRSLSPGRLLTVVILALVIGLVAGSVIRPAFGLVVGLLTMLFFGLLVGLDSVAIETKSVPNQGVHQSMKNAILIGLICGLIFSLVGELVGLISGLPLGLGVGLTAGLVLGLVIWLRYGGFAVINHYVVRYLLNRTNSMPLNYVRFLDYASERILLRKVGGGYIFIHPVLMEHFAAMEPKE